MFSLRRFSTLLLLLLFGFSAMAQCPNSLNGYTSLGEYENNKYFISNNTTNWITAQNNAASAGGHLVSITSQGENDFILNNINSIVFIGYNDQQNEGTFSWDSGESVGFNKFADTNTAEKDYGKMNNWNGNWGVDNQYVSRKHIVEIPCGNSGGGFQVDCDLNIDPAQLTVTANDFVGRIVNWSPPTATTDCPGGVTITQLGDNFSGDYLVAFFPHIVVYEVKDACGNSKICYNEVFVQGSTGGLESLADITVQATSAAGAIVNYDSPEVYQGTCTVGGAQLTSGSATASGSLFPIGTTTVSHVAFASGSNTYCQFNHFREFTVTVTAANTGGGFQVDCELNIDPSELTVTANDFVGRIVNWSPPTATTDCPGGVTVTQLGDNFSGDYLTAFFPHIVVYEVKDACGNSKICYNEVFVQGSTGGLESLADITVQATSAAGAIVNYDLPEVYQGTCTVGNPQLTSGSATASGSLFPIGTTMVSHVAFASGSNTYCQFNHFREFTVTVTAANTGSGCPNTISGFTTLGEFGNSKYYLSNNNSKPADAQVVAASNGGYLAVISSQGENDFIQQNINIMPYIGLNDVASEGNLKWVNGESLTFNNIDPCGFCSANSSSNDYVVMAPWNGKWSFSSQWNSRPYVIEIPCDGGGGGGGGTSNKPDLTLANLDNLPNNGFPNAIVNFEFDLKNIGNATATNSYVIGAYISYDNNLSSNDLLVGQITTANTFVGTDSNVPASISVPTTATGNYYLILKADINNSIDESNENNNVITKPFFIGSTGAGNCDNPPSISGFTYKVSINDKAYYLSNGTDRPTDAEAKCVSAGGHLAAANIFSINSTLASFTDGLVLIGLNDEDTEGTLEWQTGTTIANTFFDNCSICEPNSENKDYVVMQGWNGKWSWSGFYNARKYWLEVDCSSSISNSTNTLITFPAAEEKELLDFQKIVPNPASNHIFVQVKSQTAMAIDVEVYDARGMLLKSHPAELFDGINAVEIDIADLPGGFYLVKIPQMKGQYTTKRFVKVRE